MKKFLVTIYNGNNQVIDKKIIIAKNQYNAFSNYEKQYGKINTLTDSYSAIEMK